MRKNVSSADEPFRKESGELLFKPTNDYVFKKLFLANPELLKAFLSALLHMPLEEITDIEITNPYLLPDGGYAKICILDIKLILNKAMKINLEMQAEYQASWPNRSVIYLFRSFDDLSAGQSYDNLQPAKQIGILNYTLFPEEPEFFSHYMLINTKTKQIYNDKLEVCVLNLKQVNLATEDDIAHGIDLWASFFQATTWEELQMLAQKDELFAGASQALHNILQDRRERERIQSHIDAMLLVKENFQTELAEKDAEIARLKAALAQATK